MAEEAIPPRNLRRTGFRIGFMAVIVCAAVAASAYIFSPQIADALPAQAGLIDAYVGKVDSLRFEVNSWVATSANTITETLENAVGSE